MEHFTFNTEKYLKKIPEIDPYLSMDNLREKKTELDELEIPLKKIEYSDEDILRIETEDYNLDFSYSLPSEEAKGEIKRVFSGDDKKPFRSEIREAEKLVLKQKREKDVQIDFIELLPEGYKILFIPEEKFQNGSAYMDPKIIIILGDMTKPKAIIALLHEIGHAWDFEELKKAGAEKFVTDHKFEKEAEKLRRERTASAYALKKLKPFLGHGVFNKETFVKFIKDYALMGYCLNINDSMGAVLSREKRDRQAFREYDEEMEAMENERKLHEFFEWKKTDDYKKWKEIGNHKDLEGDVDEFNCWLEEQ